MSIASPLPQGEESDLPKGWVEIRLGDLVSRIEAGKNLRCIEQPPAKGKKGIVKISAVTWGEFLEDESKTLDKNDAFNSNWQIKPRDFLISRANTIELVGACVIVRSVSRSLMLSDKVLRLHMPDEWKEWLLLFLRSSLGRFQIENLATGNQLSMRNISQENLRRIVVPLPPLVEQKRIVERVGQLLGHVNTAGERLARIPVMLKRFRQAVLSAACSGRLTADWRECSKETTPVAESLAAILKSRESLWRAENGNSKRYTPPRVTLEDVGAQLPPKWCWISSDALLWFVTSGSRGWAKYYQDRGAGYLRVGNLDHDTIDLDLSEIQRVNPEASAERERTKVRPGDILVSITAEIGMIAIVPPDIGEAYVNQHVAIARPTIGFNRAYLAWFLATSKGGQAQLEELQRGATKVGLGLDDLKSLKVPFPPIEEQNEIVRRIERLLQLADTIEGHVVSATAHADNLTHAILAKAFRGELVPTEAELARPEGRSYELASTLLARIRAAGAASPCNGTSSKRPKRKAK